MYSVKNGRVQLVTIVNEVAQRVYLKSSHIRKKIVIIYGQLELWSFHTYNYEIVMLHT